MASPSPATPAPPAGDLDALLRGILENPELARSESITDEEVEELFRRLRPHSSLIGEPPATGRRALLACSYTNLREDYIRRFQMTALAGFLFQALAEWEVPEERRRWKPARRKVPRAAFTAAELAERLESVLAVVKQAAQRGVAGPGAGKPGAAGPSAGKPGAAEPGAGGPSAGKPGAAEPSAGKPSAAGPDTNEPGAGKPSAAGPDTSELGAGGPSGADGKAAPDPAAEAALVYTATHLLSRLGADATERLRAAWDAARRHAAPREVLDKFPMPAPPSEQTTPAAVAKAPIEDFLKHWLQFDPSVHVRSGHDEKALEKDLEKDLASARADAKDPERRPLASLRSPPAPRPEHAEHLAAIRAARLEAGVLALLRDPALAAAAAAAQAAPEAFRGYLEPVPESDPARPALEHVPPQDTFHRWKFYTDCNFERLRTITHALYPERPDLDLALAPWQVIEGPEAEVDRRFEEFCRKWEDKTPSSIYGIELGRGWTVLGEFRQNRERISFYNRNTEVLERIIRRHEDDQKIGAQLMKKRIQVKKAENIRNEGPDAEGLAKYRQTQGGLEAKGAQRLPPEEMKLLEEAGGSLQKAEELRLLAEYRKTIKELGAIEDSKARPLSFDEARNLEVARAHIARAEEMAAVPPGAVQVDVFRTDGRSGEFSRSHFYTEADEPAEAPQGADRGAERGLSLHPLAGRPPAAGAPTGAPAGPEAERARSLHPLAGAPAGPGPEPRRRERK